MTEPYKEALAREARQVRRLGWILAFLTAMLVVVLALYLWPMIRARFIDTNGMRTVEPRGKLADWEETNIHVAKRASPSVVFITTQSLERIPSSPRGIVREGAGSGFIWDEQGRIVTNYHVIQNSTTARVILSDQTTYEANIVGVSPDHDLAVLKIDVPLGVQLVPIPIGTSEDLQVGQATYAIGSPFGLQQTVTTGIVSGLGRSITGEGMAVPFEDIIQTSAPINPGNSGGPLLDSYGRLIGVNTLIASSSGAWSGVGLAIPVDTANRVIPQIIRTGKYERAWIGIVPYTPDRGRGSPAPVPGLIVGSVDQGSPAEKAGITGGSYTPFGRQGRAGRFTYADIITQINDRPIRTVMDLYSVLDRTPPGTTIEISVWNAGSVRLVKVTTQSTPPPPPPATFPSGGGRGGGPGGFGGRGGDTLIPGGGRNQ